MTPAAVKILQLFAEQVFQRVNQRRYGLSACVPGLDVDFCDDLSTLLQRAEQISACGPIPCTSSALPLTPLQERILTL